MIIDRIENAARYESLHPRFKKAFDFIRDMDLKTMEIGRYELEGEDLFALVQGYETKDVSEKSFETHKNYIDIQYIISGTEMIGYTGFNQLEVSEPYNPEKDVEFYTHKNYSPCILSEGFFGIYFPEDPHLPGCIAEKKESLQKLVIKIRL